MKKKQRILFFFILMLFTVLSYGQEGVLVDGVIAVVGKNPILLSELESQVTQLVLMGEERNEMLRCRVLDELLLQNFFLAHAQFDSLEVTDKELENELDRRLRYFIAQIGSREALEQYYNKSIVQIKDEFRPIVRDQLLVQKMQQKITQDIKITPTEVQRYFRNLSDEEIPDIEMEFQLAQLIIMPEISDEQKALLFQKAEELRQRIIQGTDFGAMAVLYSEDPVTAKKRGELGFFTRGEMDPDFEAAAFKLKKPGDISPVVRTRYGYHILQLIERRGEYINVRHILIKFNPSPEDVLRARNKIDSVRMQIIRGDINFFEAIRQYSNVSESGLMVNPLTGENTIGISQLESAVLFAIEHLQPGEVSDVIHYREKSGMTGYRILMVISRLPAHKATLESDYPLIHQMALEDKKFRAIQQWVDRKRKDTYIFIHESFRDCPFEYNWLKQ